MKKLFLKIKNFILPEFIVDFYLTHLSPCTVQLDYIASIVTF